MEDEVKTKLFLKKLNCQHPSFKKNWPPGKAYGGFNSPRSPLLTPMIIDLQLEHEDPSMYNVKPIYM